MELQELVNNICEELENSSLNSQRRRYLQSYLKEILEYQKNNPYTKYTIDDFQFIQINNVNKNI